MGRISRAISYRFMGLLFVQMLHFLIPIDLNYGCIGADSSELRKIARFLPITLPETRGAAAAVDNRRVADNRRRTTRRDRRRDYSIRSGGPLKRIRA